MRVRAALFDFRRADAGGGFDEYLFWRSKGAVKRMIPLELEVTSPPAGIHKWRNFLETKIEDGLPDLMSGYMLALTLGIRDKKLTERHREAGTVHLLAVSGFHVGILAAMAGLFLKRGKIKILTISVLIWSYLALAGFPPGGIRAGIMLQVYLLGLFLGKPSRLGLCFCRHSQAELGRSSSRICCGLVRYGSRHCLGLWRSSCCGADDQHSGNTSVYGHISSGLYLFSPCLLRAAFKP